jgi:hypothetical protein
MQGAINHEQLSHTGSPTSRPGTAYRVVGGTIILGRVVAPVLQIIARAPDWQDSGRCRRGRYVDYRHRASAIHGLRLHSHKTIFQ